MSLASLVKEVQSSELHLAYRPPQTYTVAVGAYTLFNVRDGAVLAVCLGGRVTGAAVGATEVRITANTVNTDAAAVAINGAVGTVVLSGLNVAATLVNAVAAPLTDALFHPKGMIIGTQPAGPGLVVATFTVGTDWTGEWFMLYRKLSPMSRVTL